MASRISSEAMARYSAERPWRVTAFWFVLLVVGVLMAGSLCSSAITNTDGPLREIPESQVAEDLIDDNFGTTGDDDESETCRRSS